MLSKRERERKREKREKKREKQKSEHPKNASLFSLLFLNFSSSFSFAPHSFLCESEISAVIKERACLVLYTTTAVLFYSFIINVAEYAHLFSRLKEKEKKCE